MNYIKRTSNGIVIDDIFNHQKGLIQYINTLCLEDGSTYKGRLNYSKTIVGNYKNPIYIHSDLVLFPTHSIRLYECVLINFFTIEHIIDHIDHVEIMFQNGVVLEVEVTYKCMQKQITRTKKLVLEIIRRKCLHRGIINRFYI